MNKTKTEIHVRENRKRTVFLVKVIVLILLLVFSEQILNFLGDSPPVVENFLLSIKFFLAANIIVSLARLTTVRLYMRRKSHDPMRSNFVLGINRIADILNVVIFLFAFRS